MANGSYIPQTNMIFYRKYLLLESLYRNTVVVNLYVVF